MVCSQSIGSGIFSYERLANFSFTNSSLGILLNAIYFLRAYQFVFLGKLNEKYKDLTDISARELFCVIPIALLVLILGVFPAPLIEIIQPTLSSLIELISSSSSNEFIFRYPCDAVYNTSSM